jgi:hypothetical protein
MIWLQRAEVLPTLCVMIANNFSRTVLVFAVVVLGSCSSPRYTPSGNSLLDLRNPDLRVPIRVDSAETAWAEMLDGQRDRDGVRRAFKDLAWSSAAAIDVRMAVVAMLLDDPDPEGQADARQMARLMLPTERSRSVVAAIASRAGEHGWEDMAAPLVRSYARSVATVEDGDRAEHIALQQIYPNQSVARTVFEVFLEPGYDNTPPELRLNERTRADVWDLLGRLDETGELRRQLIARAQTTDVSASARASINALKRGLDDLGVVPRTGDELRWLERLADDSIPKNQAWWAGSVAAVRGLSEAQRDGLELRHIEAIRWAAAHRPRWVQADRSTLYNEFAARLDERDHHKRTAEKTIHRQPRRESLREWGDALKWADILTMLVVDEAVHQPQVLERLDQQIGIDRMDRTTEYGGVIEAVEGGKFRIVLFRPRARDRTSDTAFAASEDMVRYSDRALVHYHQHVQSNNNAAYAGPSDADMTYAARSGRTCLVFTNVDKNLLNVDCYQPNSVVIDLGMVATPAMDE